MHERAKRKAVLTFVALLVLSLPFATAWGGFIQVSQYGDDIAGDGSNDYPFATIQHAIDNAVVGDTVEIGYGTYFQTQDIVMKTGVTVTGRTYNPADVVIVGRPPGDNAPVVVKFTNVTNSTLDSVSLVFDTEFDGIWGVSVMGGDRSVVIRNCIITGAMYGIWIYPGSSPTVVNNTFFGGGDGLGGVASTFGTRGQQGIYIGNGGAATPLIQNNIITGYLWQGIHFAVGSNTTTPTIEYNDIWGNGVCPTPSCGNVMQSPGGVWTPVTLTGPGNISGNPLFYNPSTVPNYGLGLQPGSPCIDAGNPSPEFNDIEEGPLPSRNDMGAYGGPFANVDAACTDDGDGDGVCDAVDNCPTVINANQADANNNGIGDVCERPDASPLTATNITSNSATLRGNFNPNGRPGIGAEFRWTTDPSWTSYFTRSNTYFDPVSGIQDVEISMNTLSGLTPGTTYYFQPMYHAAPFSWNDLGVPTSIYYLGNPTPYNIAQFTTLPAGMTPPANLQISSATGSKVTLGWTAVSGPSLKNYLVRVSPPVFFCMECSNSIVDAGDVTSATINLPSPGQTYNFSVAWKNTADAVSPYSSPPVSYTLPCLNADTDGDGIPDFTDANCTVRGDNCPTVYNPGQSDLDGDGVGDVCDNCPKVSNPLQEPSLNNSGLGKACDNPNNVPGVPKTEVKVCLKPNPDGSCGTPQPFDPGGPKWAAAKLVNGTGADLKTVRPDSHNLILVDLKDTASGKTWLPVSNTRFAYGIPKDLYTITANDCVTVQYNIERDYPGLPPGEYCGYFVYANMGQDPDVVWANGVPTCDTTPPNTAGNCYPDIFAGKIWQDGETCFTVDSTPELTQLQATVVFSPSNWDTAWGANGFGPPVTATIQVGNLAGSAIDPATIRLNGTIPIIPGSSGVSNGVLTVLFDGALAVRNLGPANAGVSFYPVVDGRFTGSSPTNSYFSGTGTVTLGKRDTILVLQADKHTVGQGSNPPAKKEGIVGMPVRAFDTACTSKYFSNTWQNYPQMWVGANCLAVAGGATDATGQIVLSLPPGNYIAIGQHQSGIYPGVSVGSISIGSVQKKYLQVIVNGQGKILPGKYNKFTGSELLVIEPEYVEWSGTTELYPFVFQSVGDWGIATSISPPKGFVPDYNQLSTAVNSDVEALQFTVTNVGSDWVSTKVHYDITHKDKKISYDSKIGIKLSKELAKKKGISEYGEEYPYGKKVVK